jgi:hypothetical protein
MFCFEALLNFLRIVGFWKFIFPTYKPLCTKFVKFLLKCQFIEDDKLTQDLHSSNFSYFINFSDLSISIYLYQKLLPSQITFPSKTSTDNPKLTETHPLKLIQTIISLIYASISSRTRSIDIYVIEKNKWKNQLNEYRVKMNEE